MKKIDLLRLRKAAGLSQKELADKLAVQPSFLSAIENGRSRFPEEKIEKLKEVLLLEDLEEYLVEDGQETTVIPPHTHALGETDPLTQLLKHIHTLAHKSDDAEKERENELMARIEYLVKRNDRLSDKIDELRDIIDRLKDENFRLKELLFRRGIEY